MKNDTVGIIITIIVGCFFLHGCGPSQKQLRQIDTLLEKSKKADCITIRSYLDGLQIEVEKMLK